MLAIGASFFPCSRTEQINLSTERQRLYVLGACAALKVASLSILLYSIFWSANFGCYLFLGRLGRFRSPRHLADLERNREPK
jgi:hypothetical protein